MNARATEGISQQGRLDSWKSISQYLDRSCRTVQRWQVENSLPIHRLNGEKGAVFAYTDELDKWVTNRGLPTADKPPGLHGPVLTHAHSAVKSYEPADEGSYFLLVPHQAKVRSAELVALAYKIWKTLSHSNLHSIARLFREAIDLDPGNANAFAGLGNALVAQGLLGIVRAPAAYSSAKAALHRALEMDSENAEAKCTMAWFKMVSSRDWSAARRGLNEVVEVQHTSTQGLVGRGMYHIAEGRLLEASNVLREATQKYTLNSIAIGMHCWCEYLAGEYRETLLQIESCRASGQCGLLFDAVEALASIQIEQPAAHIKRIESLVADSPHYAVLQGALGYAFAKSGQSQKACEILDTLALPSIHGKIHEHYGTALILIGLGRNQEATKQLEQSYRDGSLWSLGFRSDPILSSLGIDPHYQRFLTRVSYPEP